VSARSLRAKLLLGAVLWTIGLLLSSIVAITAMMLQHGSLPRIVHLTTYRHAEFVLPFSVVCMVAGYLLYRSSVSPLRALQARVAAVRGGSEQVVTGAYPSEVQPLVQELNALLDHRQRAVTRALAKAGDLAHGLKTPLAVLAHDAARAKAAGQTELAVSIEQQVDRMRRQVEYHLAQARAAASGTIAGATCRVAESSDALTRTLLRLHADRGMAIEQHVDREHAVQCSREDLDEMLGNLLDNACKYATSRVVITSTLAGAQIMIAVADDGPGLAPHLRESVLQRGVRADEAAPGSGLGLAIVRDLAELYGGTVTLDTSRSLSGLEVRLLLPAASQD
jgi:signal transduction histidine kinase